MLPVTAKGISCLWNLQVFVVSNSVKQAFQWSKNWNATFENARQKQLGVYFLSLPNMSNQNKPNPHEVPFVATSHMHGHFKIWAGIVWSMEYTNIMQIRP